MRLLLRALAGFLVIVMSGGVLLAADPVAATGMVTSGACVFDLDVQVSGGTLLLDASAVDACTTNLGSADLLLNAGLAGLNPGFSCTDGMLTGAGRDEAAQFTLTIDGNPEVDTSNLLAAGAVEGAALEFGFEWREGNTRFLVGEGAFVLSSDSASPCDPGFPVTTWTGQIIFDDPDVS